MWREWMVDDWHWRLRRVWGEWDRERGCTRSEWSAGKVRQILAGDVACSGCEDAMDHWVWNSGEDDKDARVVQGGI
jgi:hypothetical protein